MSESPIENVIEPQRGQVVDREIPERTKAKIVRTFETTTLRGKKFVYTPDDIQAVYARVIKVAKTTGTTPDLKKVRLIAWRYATTELRHQIGLIRDERLKKAKEERTQAEQEERDRKRGDVIVAKEELQLLIARAVIDDSKSRLPQSLRLLYETLINHRTDEELANEFPDTTRATRDKWRQRAREYIYKKEGVSGSLKRVLDKRTHLDKRVSRREPINKETL